MATIGDLVVNLRANTSQFAGKMKGSRKELKDFGRTVAPLASSLAAGGPLAAGLAVVAGGFFAVQKAARKAIKEIEVAFDRLDKLAKLSDKTGFSPEDIAAFQLGAGLTGASVEKLNKALEQFVQRIGEAQLGTGEAVQGLRLLGLSAKELAKQKPGEAFRQVAERIAALPSATDRATAAFFIMGRQGKELVNFLSQGRDGIDAFIRKNRELDGVFTRFDLAQIELVNDQILELTTLIDNEFGRAAVELAPTIIAITKAMLDFGKAVAGSGGALLDAAADFEKFLSTSHPAIAALRAISLKFIAPTFEEAAVNIVKDANSIASATKKSAGGLGETNAEFEKLLELTKFAEKQKRLIPTPQEVFDETRSKVLAAQKKELLNLVEAERAIGAARDKFNRDSGFDRIAEQRLQKQKRLQEQTIRDQQQVFQKLQDEAKRVFDETRNPFEKFRIEVERLRRLRGLNLIDPDTFIRKVRQLREQTSTEREAVDRFSPGAPGARAGSQQFFDRILAATTRGEGPDERSAKALEKLVAAERNRQLVLERIKENTGRASVLRRSSMS